MRLVTQILASVAALLGLVVIIGWYFGLPVLIQLHEDLVPMQFNTALCLLLMGISLFLLTLNCLKSSAIFSALVVFLSSLILIQYIFLEDIGIDRLFVYSPKELIVRMAPNTAVCFVLIGIASFLLSVPQYLKYFLWLIQLNIILVLGLSSFGLLGYASGYQVTFEWGPLVQMALLTSIGLLLLSVGHQNHLFTLSVLNNTRGRFFPFVISSVVITFFLIIALFIRINHIEKIQESIEARNQLIEDVLVGALDFQEKTLGRMVKRVNVDDDFQVTEWKSDAIQYIEDIDSLHALGLHLKDGDKKLVVASVSDLEDLDLSDLVSEGFVNSALLSLNIKGVDYLAFIIPSSEKTNKESTLVALYSLVEFINGVIPPHLTEDYNLKITLKGKDGVVDGPEIDSPFYRQKDFEAYNSKIVLNLSGKPESFLEEINIINIIIIVVGFILGLALSYLIIFANKAALREQEALAANQAKNVFISNISHEVRNPLNSILGATSLLQETELDEKQRKYTTNIENSGSHVLALVQEILDVSKLESGQLSLNLSKQPVRKLYEEIISVVSPKIENKGLKLISTLHAYYDEIMTDPLRLKQVAINILDNAIKFTEKGEIEFRMDIKEDGYMYVKIKDSGIGIPKEKLPFIFDKFYQVDLSDKKRVRGIGLGLSICKEIVAKLGGTIKVESQLGKGTTFSFSIPVIDKK